MSEQVISGGTQQPLCFSSDDFPSSELALERFRKLAEYICDVILLGELKDFHVSSATLHLGGAVMIEARSSALRYDRTPRHVMLGIDHFQVVMYLRGGAEFVASNRTYLQRAGDIGVIDMGKPSMTREMQGEDGTTQGLSFVMPRAILEPMLGAATNAPTIRIIPREAPYVRMLTDYILSLRRSAAALTHVESQAALNALAQLVAGACNRTLEAEPFTDEISQDSLRARIKTHIEDNIGLPSLGVEALCSEFGLSRAGLYRFFAPQSPISYIQQRRLHRAYAILISPAFRAWRILDVALECQFASDATFIRAFRRQFGLSPGEVRKLAEQKILGAPPGSGPPLPEPDAEASRWISQLTGAIAIAGDRAAAPAS